MDSARSRTFGATRRTDAHRRLAPGADRSTFPAAMGAQLVGLLLGALVIQVDGAEQVDGAWSARVVRRIEATVSERLRQPVRAQPPGCAVRGDCDPVTDDDDKLMVRFTPGIDRVSVTLERRRPHAADARTEIVSNPEDGSWSGLIDAAIAQLYPDGSGASTSPEAAAPTGLRVGPLVTIAGGAALATAGLVFAMMAQSTASGLDDHLVFQPNQHQTEGDRVSTLEWTGLALVVGGVLMFTGGIIWGELFDPDEPSLAGD